MLVDDSGNGEDSDPTSDPGWYDMPMRFPSSSTERVPGVEGVVERRVIPDTSHMYGPLGTTESDPLPELSAVIDPEN